MIENIVGDLVWRNDEQIPLIQVKKKKKKIKRRKNKNKTKI